MRTRRGTLATVFWLPLFLAGCSASPKMAVSVKKGTTYTSGDSITVVAKSTDHYGIQGKLEHYLLSSGFEVVSEAVARKRLQYQDEIQDDREENRETSKATASVERVTQLRSAYLLQFSYVPGDIPVKAMGLVTGGQPSFASLTFSIVNLATGEVVGTGEFSQICSTFGAHGRFGAKTFNDVLKELVAELKRTMDRQ